jgi:hypothetical protein
MGVMDGEEGVRREGRRWKGAEVGGWRWVKKKARNSGKGDNKNRRWVVKGPHLPFFPSFPL